MNDGGQEVKRDVVSCQLCQINLPYDFYGWYFFIFVFRSQLNLVPACTSYNCNKAQSMLGKHANIRH